ncbi:unnamed protein product [Rotaria magnacalcarata]|uniref:Uncharacterized protein n=1 Tax=Rotaria magnacalcarata TaxID=392030 RepID=A0A816ZK11_9BILA|nr:unnamed protein product [Rotaria magnacalcarata]CAF3996946.1 unnamed protein product [Rotaria magnacalcarata]
MGDFNENNAAELVDPISQEVTEIEYTTATPLDHWIIKWQIAYDYNRFDGVFGQTEPHRGHRRFNWRTMWHNIYGLMMNWKRPIIFALFMIILGCSYMNTKISPVVSEDLKANNTLKLPMINSTPTGMPIQEDGSTCDVNEIVQDQLDININGNKSTQIVTNKSYVQHVVLEKSTVQSSCLIADFFMHAFKKLFCWDDGDTHNTLNELHEDSNYQGYVQRYIFDDDIITVKNIGESLSCIKKFFIDIVRDQQINQKAMIEEQCIPDASFSDASFDQKLQPANDD